MKRKSSKRIISSVKHRKKTSQIGGQNPRQNHLSCLKGYNSQSRQKLKGYHPNSRKWLGGNQAE